MDAANERPRVAATHAIVGTDVVINNPPPKHGGGVIATLLACLGIGTVIYVGVPALRHMRSTQGWLRARNARAA